MVALDPVARDEVHHDGLIDSAWGFVVDILHAGIELQPGILQVAIHPVVLLPGPLAIHDEAENFREGKTVHVRMIELFGKGLRRQSQFMKLFMVC